MGVYYPDMEDVLLLHKRRLEKFGGAPCIRDAGLIEAALENATTPVTLIQSRNPYVAP